MLKNNLPLIRKNTVTDMDGLAVYLKEGLPFIRDLSLGNSADYIFVFERVYFIQFFLFYRLSSSSLCKVFDAISSNIDEVFG